MAGPATLLVVFTALFAAPLVLGTYAAVQRSGPLFALGWLLFLTGLLLFALAAGAWALLGLL